MLVTIDNKWIYTGVSYDSFWRVQDVHHHWWLAKGGAGSAFHYDAARRRAVQLEFDSMAGGAPEHYTKKRLYALGSTMEVDYINQTATGAGMDWKLDSVRVYVPGPEGNLGAMEFNSTAPPSRAETARVYHTDHLGSIETITDFGSTTVALDKAGRASRYSYDPWGQRRNTQTWSGPPPPDSQGGQDDITPRGFTGHEMLDDLGLVHMNGRIYDGQIGRVLSADVVVQRPEDLQSHNRYSYVWNNPLRYTDPSGYEVFAAARDLAGLAAIGTHQFIIAVPDNPDDFENLVDLGNGKKAFVMGAHNRDGRLLYVPNEPSDLQAAKEWADPKANKRFYLPDFDTETKLVETPEGKTDSEFISELIANAANYSKNEAEKNIPYPKLSRTIAGGVVNSNSWAPSLIESAGGSYDTDFKGRDPGRNQRIDPSYFEEPEKSDSSSEGGNLSDPDQQQQEQDAVAAAEAQRRIEEEQKE